MEETKKAFNKGDFIKYSTYNGATENKTTFGIFEGVDLAPDYQYTKIAIAAVLWITTIVCAAIRWFCLVNN